MRSYTLILTDPTTGQVWKPVGDGFSLQSGGSTFSSLDSNGSTLPGALNIEFDLAVVGRDQAQGGARITVWGVGLGMISQAANLNGSNFQLSAGMARGLPLANPAQAGVIAEGSIYQAFGNWEGTNQTLELVCNPGLSAPETNIAFKWVPGQSLANALNVTLYQAFGQLKYDISINVSQSLTPRAPQAGTYSSIENFASYLTQYTKALGAKLYGPNYTGVIITVGTNTITASDAQGAVAPKLIQLQFQDLIGQPTWIAPNTISFKTVLRSDIAIDNNVQFPLGAQNALMSPYVLMQQGAAYPNMPVSNKPAFQGTFRISEMHHFANFRQPDADSWVTAFTAAAT